MGVHGKGALHVRGTYVVGGCAWSGGMCDQAGGACVAQGACMVTGGMCGQGGSCMAEGMHGRGACMVGRACMVEECAWSQGACMVRGGACMTKIWLVNVWLVHILLEYILVYNVQLCGFQCITGYSICILVIFPCIFIDLLHCRVFHREFMWPWSTKCDQMSWKLVNCIKNSLNTKCSMHFSVNFMFLVI